MRESRVNNFCKNIINYQTICSLIAGLVYACLYAIGFEIDVNKTCVLRNVAIRILFSFPLFSLLFEIALFISKKCFSRRKDAKHVPTACKCFLVILISFIPMYVVLYPGSFDYDSGTQIRYVMEDVYNMHHPLLHTLFIKMCIDAIQIMKSPQAGAVVYALLQMIGIAWMFALICVSVSRSFGNRAGWYCCAFFSIYPTHAYLASNMTKDVLFAGAFALMVTLCIESWINDRYTFKHMMGILISTMLAILLRNNMIYAVVVWLVFLLFLKRTKKWILIVTLMLSVLLSVGTNAGMQKNLNATPGNPREMLSLPGQQLARAYMYYESAFTKDEQKQLDQLIPARSYRKYIPSCADPVKNEIEINYIKTHPKQFIKLYLSIFKKCTQQYVDAAAAQMSPYLYPYQKYSVEKDYLEMQIIPDSFDRWFGEGSVRRLPAFEKIREWMNEHIWRTGANGIPVFRWLFNMGLISWIMLFFLLRDLRCKQWNGFLLHSIIVLFWGTNLLGPVMLGRYIYPIVCTLPILAWPIQKNVKRIGDT